MYGRLTSCSCSPCKIASGTVSEPAIATSSAAWPAPMLAIRPARAAPSVRRMSATDESSEIVDPGAVKLAA